MLVTPFAKSSLAPRDWNDKTVFKELEARHDKSVVDAARSIVDWMTVHADKILFGHGKVDGSITAMFLFGSEKHYPLMLSTNGRVIVNFGYCSRGLFLPELKRKEWLVQLKSDFRAFASARQHLINIRECRWRYSRLTTALYSF